MQDTTKRSCAASHRMKNLNIPGLPAEEFKHPHVTSGGHLQIISEVWEPEDQGRQDDIQVGLGHAVRSPAHPPRKCDTALIDADSDPTLLCAS